MRGQNLRWLDYILNLIQYLQLNFIDNVNKSSPNFELVINLFTKAKYEKLLDKEKILDVKQMPCEKMHSEFLMISQKALLPDQEQKLVK